jgi:single-stranded-DNA-specific exonuclease
MARYTVRQKAPKDVHDALAEHPEVVRDLLHTRGVSDAKSAIEFLYPSFERESHDPMKLPGMSAAVDRILHAIAGNEKICIWSDYDCDGIPGGALLHDFFKLIGYNNFINYIPHRHLEGYGLNERGLSDVKKEGVTLVITVDSGITDVAPVAHANSLGLDVIVTDHHLPGPELPPALAVINPKLVGSEYTFDGLCGTGVAWKLVQAILSKNRFGVSEGKEKWLLDLVGLATVADMMELRGENRMLVHYGLVVMRKSPRPGLRALLALSKTRQNLLTEDDIGFTIAPRINAASRMDEPRRAFELLTSRDEVEAAGLAKHLQHMNDVRKGVVAATVKEVHGRLREEGIPSGVIVMGNPHWRPGLLGLVANGVKEAHARTVFLWGREGGDTIKGSCRSDGSVNVVELMQEAKDIFIDFGGHKYSGGFSVHADKIHDVRASLERAYEVVRTRASAQEPVFVDRELPIEDVSKTLPYLERLAPFGMGNEKPLFIIPGVQITHMKQFGKTNNHIELTLGGAGDSRLTAMTFFKTPEDFEKVPSVGQHIDVVGHLERGVFDRRARLRLVDIV